MTERSASESATIQIASFFVADELYGVPVLLVEEFFRAVEVTRIPRADRRIAGLINLRGKTAVTLDLRRCLDRDDQPESARSMMILLETQEELTEEARALGIEAFDDHLALRVDRVHKVLWVERSAIHPAPAHLDSQFVDGVVRLESGYLTVLHIRRLIDDILEGRS